MRRTALSLSFSALLLTSLLALPAAASADGGTMLTSGGKSTAANPTFGSGHNSAKRADGGYYGSGHKDGGTIVTSGGLRAWTFNLLRTWLRLPLSPRRGM